MIKLYGEARSRASRSLWMLEEIGLAYEHVPVRAQTQSRSAEYLGINPNGKIPALDDDGFVLWESLAINFYLADRYGSPPLWPESAQSRGRAYQWSFWAANEVEPNLIGAAISLRGKTRDPASIAAAIGQVTARLQILENALGAAEYLLGTEFTIADLNLSSTLREPGEEGIAGMAEIDTSPFPDITRWLDQCAARPANRRVANLP